MLTQTERQQKLIEEAEYFTVIRFCGVGVYERREVSNKDEAMKLAEKLCRETQKNYLVYAVKGTQDTYVTSFQWSKDRGAEEIR